MGQFFYCVGAMARPAVKMPLTYLFREMIKRSVTGTAYLYTYIQSFLGVFIMACAYFGWWEDLLAYGGRALCRGGGRDFPGLSEIGRLVKTKMSYF